MAGACILKVVAFIRLRRVEREKWRKEKERQIAILGRRQNPEQGRLIER